MPPMQTPNAATAPQGEGVDWKVTSINDERVGVPYITSKDGTITFRLKQHKNGQLVSPMDKSMNQVHIKIQGRFEGTFEGTFDGGRSEEEHDVDVSFEGDEAQMITELPGPGEWKITLGGAYIQTIRFSKYT